MTVTIVIPTYKRVEYLREALKSVVAQTFEDFECLVVNDFPPFVEQVEEVVREFQDPRIQVLHNPENSGESRSRNHAISKAKGTIIALLDDDDIWEPEFLEQHVHVHQQHPQVGLVYSGYTRFWDHSLLGKQVRPATSPVSEGMYQAMISGRFVLASSSIVSVKKICFEECGVFDPSLPSFADWDMWVRIAEHYPFKHIETPLTQYRHHLGERGSTDIEKRLTGINVISQKWESREGFSAFRKKLTVRAYFNEIRNEVLRGNRRSGLRLLRDCFRRCRRELFPNRKIFAKAVIIVLLGKNYQAGHRKMYQ